MAGAFNLTAELNLRGPSNIKTVVADIRRQIGTINANVNIKLDPNATRNATQLNSALKSLNSTFGQTQTAATNAARAIANFGSAINRINIKSLPQQINNSAAAVTKLSNASAGSSKAIQAATTEMQEFGKQSFLAIKRFAAFSLSAGAIYQVTNAVSKGVEAFIEYDRQLVKLQQVTGESANGLRNLSGTITSLATGLGVASSDITEIASTLAQAGLSARDTERALKALALSSLAPSFDSMNETVEGSIALMRQFGISASDLEKALGSVNAVAAKFAVESSDIITAIQRTGGVFATASKGVSEGTDALNEFIAVFTSVRATTRESAETIATGLRTIFTRIQRGGTIDALKEYGVNLTDVEGKFVGAYRAVELLSQGLSKLDPRDLKFSQIVEELGGFRQIGKVIPLIQQFATAQDALKVAQRGQGSLAADAAKAQESLSNKIIKVREEFLALFREIGSSQGFQTLVRGALDLSSALIKVADSVKGILPVLGVLAAFRGASALTQFAAGFAGAAKPKTKSLGGPISKFATGGYVPGVGNSDTVPAMLTPGEFVIRKKAVESIGVSNLHKMNKYAGGGEVSVIARVLRDRNKGSKSVRELITDSASSQDYKSGKAINVNDTITFKKNVYSLNKPGLVDDAGGFEKAVAKKVRGNLTSISKKDPSFPIDVTSSAYGPLEVRNRKVSTSSNTLLDKLIRYYIEQRQYNRLSNRPQTDKIDLGKLGVVYNTAKYSPSDATRLNTGGLVQKFMPGGLVKSLEDMLPSEILQEAKKLGVGIPFEARDILKKRKALSLPEQQIKNQLFANIRAARGAAAESQERNSRLAGTRSVAVVGLQGQREAAQEVMIPGAISKSGLSARAVPATLEVGALPAGLAKRVQARIRNSIERLVADVGQQIAKAAGSKATTGRKAIRNISSKDIDDLAGPIFEKALGVASGNYDPTSVSADFLQGLSPKVAQLVGVSPGVITDITSRTSSARGKLEQLGRARLEAREKFGRSPFNKGGSVRYKLGGQVYNLQKGTGLSNGEFDQLVKYANTNDFTEQEFKGYLKKYLASKAAKKNLMMDPVQLRQVLLSGTRTQPSSSKQMDLARQLMGPPDAKYNPKYDNVRKFALGGSAEDTVPALLTPGEFVINKKAAQKIGIPRLNRLNKADKIQGYNKGGFVQRFAAGGQANDPDVNLFASKLIRDADISNIGLFTSSVSKLSEKLVPTGSMIRLVTSSLGGMGTETQKVQQASLRGRASLGQLISAIEKDLLRAAASGKYSIDQLAQAEKTLQTVRDVQATSAAALGQRKGAVLGSVPGFVGGAFNNTLGRLPGAGLARGLGSRISGIGGALGGNTGFYGSIALGMLAGQGESIFGKETGRRSGGYGSDAMTAAGFEAGTSTLATGLATAGSLAMIPGVGPFAAGIVAATTVVKAWTSAVEAGKQAAEQFADQQRQTKIDESGDRLTKAFENFQRNPSDVRSQTAVIASASTLAKNIAEDSAKDIQTRSDQLVRNRSWTDFFAGVTPTMGGDELRRMSQESAKRAEPAADAARRVLEARIESGSTMADISKMPDFKTLAETIASANPEFVTARNVIMAMTDAQVSATGKTREQLIAQRLNEQALNLSSDSYLKAKESTMLAAKAMDEANKAGRDLAISFQTMSNTFSQAMGRVTFELEQFDKGVANTVSSFQGQAKVGQVSSLDANILRNPRAYSAAERAGAQKRASGFFGRESGTVEKMLGINAQDFGASITKSVQNALATNRDLPLEDAVAAARKNLTDQLKDAPENVRNEILQKFEAIVKSIETDKDKGQPNQIKVDKLIEDIQGQLGGAASESAKAVQEMAIAILDFRNGALNEFINATNMAAEAQIKAQQARFRSEDTIISGRDRLNQALGLSGPTPQDIQARQNARIAQLTGGVTDPTAIRQNIEKDIEQQRRLEARKEQIANDPTRQKEFGQLTTDISNLSIKIKNGQDALDQLADSSDVASASLEEIQKIQQAFQGQGEFLDRLASSTPEEAEKLGRAFQRLENNLAGGLNTAQNSAQAQKAFLEALRGGATPQEARRAGDTALAQQRGEVLSLFQDLIPVLQAQGRSDEDIRLMQANLREGVYRESGILDNPVLGALARQQLEFNRNPLSDPRVAENARRFDQATTRQANAQFEQGSLAISEASFIMREASIRFTNAVSRLETQFGTMREEDLRARNQPVNPARRARGGIIYANEGQLVNFTPKGTDTVPAMLTPGEFVVNRAATEKHLPLLKAINSGGYSKGGVVQYFQQGTRNPVRPSGRPGMYQIEPRTEYTTRTGFMDLSYTDESGQLVTTNGRVTSETDKTYTVVDRSGNQTIVTKEKMSDASEGAIKEADSEYKKYNRRRQELASVSNRDMTPEQKDEYEFLRNRYYEDNPELKQSRDRAAERAYRYVAADRDYKYGTYKQERFTGAISETRRRIARTREVLAQEVNKIKASLKEDGETMSDKEIIELATFMVGKSSPYNRDLVRVIADSDGDGKLDDGSNIKTEIDVITAAYEAKPNQFLSSSSTYGRGRATTRDPYTASEIVNTAMAGELAEYNARQAQVRAEEMKKRLEAAKVKSEADAKAEMKLEENLGKLGIRLPSAREAYVSGSGRVSETPFEERGVSAKRVVGAEARSALAEQAVRDKFTFKDRSGKYSTTATISSIDAKNNTVTLAKIDPKTGQPLLDDKGQPKRVTVPIDKLDAGSASRIQATIKRDTQRQTTRVNAGINDAVGEIKIATPDITLPIVNEDTKVRGTERQLVRQEAERMSKVFPERFAGITADQQSSNIIMDPVTGKYLIDGKLYSRDEARAYVESRILATEAEPPTTQRDVERRQLKDFLESKGGDNARRLGQAYIPEDLSTTRTRMQSEADTREATRRSTRTQIATDVLEMESLAEQRDFDKQSTDKRYQELSSQYEMYKQYSALDETGKTGYYEKPKPLTKAEKQELYELEAQRNIPVLKRRGDVPDFVRFDGRAVPQTAAEYDKRRREAAGISEVQANRADRRTFTRGLAEQRAKNDKAQGEIAEVIGTGASLAALPLAGGIGAVKLGTQVLGRSLPAAAKFGLSIAGSLLASGGQQRLLESTETGRGVLNRSAELNEKYPVLSAVSRFLPGLATGSLSSGASSIREDIARRTLSGATEAVVGGAITGVVEGRRAGREKGQTFSTIDAIVAAVDPRNFVENFIGGTILPNIGDASKPKPKPKSQTAPDPIRDRIIEKYKPLIAEARAKNPDNPDSIKALVDQAKEEYKNTTDRVQAAINERDYNSLPFLIRYATETVLNPVGSARTGAQKVTGVIKSYQDLKKQAKEIAAQKAAKGEETKKSIIGRQAEAYNTLRAEAIQRGEAELKRLEEIKASPEEIQKARTKLSKDFADIKSFFDPDVISEAKTLRERAAAELEKAKEAKLQEEAKGLEGKLPYSEQARPGSIAAAEVATRAATEAQTIKETQQATSSEARTTGSQRTIEQMRASLAKRGPIDGLDDDTIRSIYEDALTINRERRIDYVKNRLATASEQIKSKPRDYQQEIVSRIGPDGEFALPGALPEEIAATAAAEQTARSSTTRPVVATQTTSTLQDLKEQISSKYKQKYKEAKDSNDTETMQRLTGQANKEYDEARMQMALDIEKQVRSQYEAKIRELDAKGETDELNALRQQRSIVLSSEIEKAGLKPFVAAQIEKQNREFAAMALSDNEAGIQVKPDADLNRLGKEIETAEGKKLDSEDRQFERDESRRAKDKAKTEQQAQENKAFRDARAAVVATGVAGAVGVTGTVYTASSNYAQSEELKKQREREDEQRRQKAEEDKKKKPVSRAQNRQTGGIIYANNGALISARSSGTDTVPAMLTPGEFVVNRNAAQMHMPLLNAINKGYYNRGGLIQYLNNGGIVSPRYYAAGTVNPVEAARSVSSSRTAGVNNGRDQAPSTPDWINELDDKINQLSSTLNDSLGNMYSNLNNVANQLTTVSQELPREMSITSNVNKNLNVTGVAGEWSKYQGDVLRMAGEQSVAINEQRESALSRWSEGAIPDRFA